MGVEVKQGRRDASVEGPKVMAASEIGPTTYAEGGVVRQETWQDYQPEVAEEMEAAKQRAEAAQRGETPEVQPHADGGRPFADRGAAPAAGPRVGEGADARREAVKAAPDADAEGASSGGKAKGGAAKRAAKSSK